MLGQATAFIKIFKILRQPQNTMYIYAMFVPEWICHNAEINTVIKRLMKLYTVSYFK